MEKVDYLIVGGGIVGLATAKALREREPRASIAVLEKEPALGAHASGRNSGVLHSGIYYPASTLKAKVCAAGAERMREYAGRRGVRWERSGKVIVATRPEEMPALERLLANARENRIPVERLDEAGLRRVEPRAAGIAALHSPSTSVIDARGVLKALQEDLTGVGVRVELGTPAGAVDPGRRVLRTPKGDFSYGFFFNCAGAYADTLARPFGLCRDHALVPFKGLYYELRRESDHLVKSSIYPVPDPQFPFLGVHFTRNVEGKVYVGPTAIPALGRENYGVFKGLNPAEVPPILWRLLRLYAVNDRNFRGFVHAEAGNYMKSRFTANARKLVPDVTAADLAACHKVGIRPQLVNVKTGALEMDFRLEKTADSLHVLNAISPAFTSAFAFADVILEEAFAR